MKKVLELLVIEGLALMFVFNLVFQHLAMILAFLVGRYLFRDYILYGTSLFLTPNSQRAIRNHYFKGINLACKSHGTYITFLLRCSFVLPFFLVSYTLSVTDCKVFIWSRYSF